jgi:hypothetical protein
LRSIIFIFFEPRVVGKHGRKDIGGHWKGPKEFIFRQQSCPKKFMEARNINVLVGEN